MRFELPDAVAAMNDALAAAGDEGGAWDVVGDPLREPVEEVLPAYDEKLDLKLTPSPGDKRLEISGLAWGRIGKDAARLAGLAAAVDNIAAVVRSGKERLAHDWKGEAFDSFRLAIEKIETTLDDYSAAVRAAASDLETALDNIRTLFGTYREQSLSTHLTFDGLAEPDQWWRLSLKDAEFLAGQCTAWHSNRSLGKCGYDNGEQVGIIDGQLVNRKLFDELAGWDCTDDPGVVTGQYRTTVDAALRERSLVSGKIHNWYAATDQLKRDVDAMLGAALENLRTIAESRVFAASVPGASADPPAAQHPILEPSPTGESVTIKDGTRSISVTSPDDEGHVKVTIDRDDAPAKNYDLDFDAASGLPPRSPEEQPAAGPNVERVAAGSNGQCVLRDGTLTITAERPLFDPGTLKVEVDDGVNEPTTHTLDFEATREAARSAAAEAPPEPPTESVPVAAAELVPESRAEPVPVAAAELVPEARAELAQVPAAEPAPALATEPAAAATEHAPESGAEPTQVAAVELALEPPAEPASMATIEPAQMAAAESAPESQAESAQVAVAELAPEPRAEPMPVAATEPAVVAVAEPAMAGQPDAEPELAAVQVTTTQAAFLDETGSLSGVLVPDQSTGEAELASAGEDEPAGAAGAAMPMMAGAGATAVVEAGRAGTGWSVHGDLFDNHDPVYSMHGTLGEEDLKGR